MEVILARMERAIGDEAMALVRTQLDLWTRSGLTDVIEEWRQRQMARMFNLSEFVRCVKLRFTVTVSAIGITSCVQISDPE